MYHNTFLVQKKYGKRQTRLLKCHNNHNLELLAFQQPQRQKRILYLPIKTYYDKEKQKCKP